METLMPSFDGFPLSDHGVQLPQEDYSEYLRLRTRFREQSKYSRLGRVVCFSQELLAVLEFIERSPIGREDRSIVVGLAFAGPCICVNTQHLKTLLGRSKSSLNGSFQQIGYGSMKAHAGEWLAAVLPSLANKSGLLRQWTIRIPSEDASVFFVSKSQLPQIPEPIKPLRCDSFVNPMPGTIRESEKIWEVVQEGELIGISENDLQLESGDLEKDDMSNDETRDWTNSFSDIMGRSQSVFPKIPSEWDS
jgi:hypothetical protein